MGKARLVELQADVLVLGGGAAGLCAALAARAEGKSVLLASLAPAGTGNATAVAGGVMAAALGIADAQDTPEVHAADILRSGQGLAGEGKALLLAEGIVALLPWLERMGVRFQYKGERPFQFLSPGHSRPRTLVFLPHRGTALSMPLRRAAEQAGVEFLHAFAALRLLKEGNRVAGVLGWDDKAGSMAVARCGSVVLAGGGAGLFYPRSGIPALCPGNSVAMALSAGARAIDMEFVQFYPTVLCQPGTPHYILDYLGLLDRGAALRNNRGEDVLARHALGEPAQLTRDRLTAAMACEVEEGRSLAGGTLLLDLRGYRLPKVNLVRHLGSFHVWLQEQLAVDQGIMSRGLLVAPFAHYFLGGLLADRQGFTGVEGLYACGEVTGGMHGANRLEGNSLAETIVFGQQAGRAAALNAAPPPAGLPQQWEEAADLLARESAGACTTVEEAIAELHALFADAAGPLRSAASLQEGLYRLAALSHTAPFAGRERKGRLLAAVLPGALETARLILRSALERQETRGCHQRADFPVPDPAGATHLIWTGGEDWQLRRGQAGREARF